MTDKHHKLIFGPVPSRRLGRSLGVDLVPYKVCSYDCIYCQVGKTTRKTATRDEYVPTDEVLAELAQVFEAGCECDYVTLSGSGEPTLHRDVGRIIARIKELTDTPVAVLTNGSLLSDPQVRKDLMQADLVVPSLDAADPETFEAINRPCAGLDFDAMVEGLAAFRREYPSAASTRGGSTWRSSWRRGSTTPTSTSPPSRRSSTGSSPTGST